MVISVVIWMFIIFGIPVGGYFFLKMRTVGRLGVFMLEKDKHVNFMLRKVKGPHWSDKNETYGVDPKRVRLVRYPFGWPAIFQQVIPCALYQREHYQPLDIIQPIDWNSLKSANVNATEVGTVLDPMVLVSILKGASGAAPTTSRFQRMFPMLMVGLCTVILLFLFYLLSKVGGLSGQVEEIHKNQILSMIYMYWI